MARLTIEAASEELKANGVEFTRRDYMDNRVGHEEYYGQFVTPSVEANVIMYIGKAKIAGSADQSFNDIPLRKFDAIAHLVPSRLISLSNMFTQAEENAVPSVSLSDRVCILKAAARMVKERELAKLAEVV